MKKNISYDLDMRIRIKIDGVITYGSGISKLLQKVDQLGSINAAAKDMGMTYIKALAIIKNAEDKLNKKLLEKSIGGVGGGGSKLTEFGQNFVYQFSLLEAEVKEHTLKLMNKYFPEGWSGKSL